MAIKRLRKRRKQAFAMPFACPKCGSIRVKIVGRWRLKQGICNNPCCGHIDNAQEFSQLTNCPAISKQQRYRPPEDEFDEFELNLSDYTHKWRSR